MDSLQNKLENMNIDNTNNIDTTSKNNLEDNLNDNLDNLIHHVENMTLKHKKQASFPNLKLEVRNIYCRKYFDDEDFIYMRFDIPYDVYNQVEVFSNGNISTDAIYTFLSKVSEEEFNEQPIILNRFHLVSYLFSQVRYYYENEESLEDLHPFLFDPDFMSLSYNLTCQLIEECIFDPDSETHQQLNNYDKEIIYGCGIIIHQIQLIIHSYQQLNINSMDNIKQTHKERLIRLINNICVCVLYFKFKGDYIDENGYESDMEEENHYNWKIITEM